MVLALAAGDEGAAARAFAHQPNWERVQGIAAAHQVAPLCYFHARRFGGDRKPWVPESLLARWKAAYMMTLLANRVLTRELVALRSALRDRGVESLYLKGPSLSHRAYPDPGTRPVGDIDLCVREGDYAEAHAALLAAGYRTADPVAPSSVAALHRAHYGGQLRYTAPARRLVELHFRLRNVGVPARDENWVWRSARTLELDGGSVLVPGPEAMLASVVLHANQHAFGSLRLLHDIRYVLAADFATPDAPMDSFLAQVRRWGFEAATHHALLLAGRLAGATPPRALLDATRPGWTRRRIFEAVWDLPAVLRLESRRWPQELEAPILALAEMGDPREKLRYLRGVVREAGGLGPLVRRLRELRATASG